MLSAWVLSACSLILLGAAGLHRLQLHKSSYVKSPLIPVEFIMLIVVFILVVIYVILALALLIRRQWRELVIIWVNALIGAGSIVGAALLDAPTLLYMT